MKYYRFLVFITAVLSFYVFNENLYANGKGDTSGECGGALTVSVPSVLQPVGRLGTKMEDISAADVFMRGIFSFPIGDKQRKHIEIEYKFDDNNNGNRAFPREAGFDFLKKVLDEMPASLLSKVNKITLLFTKKFELPYILVERLFGIGTPPSEGPMGVLGFSAQEQLEETYHHSLAANEITLMIPLERFDSVISSLTSRELSLVLARLSDPDPAPPRRVRKFYFDVFVTSYLKYRMRHKLGYVMAYHRYGQLTPDQDWRNAISADNKSVSQYGDTHITRDFAEAMAVYLSTNAGLNYPDIVESYKNRFAILDEVIGLDPSERDRITEGNRLLVEQTDELKRLLQLMGIIDDEGVVVYQNIPKEEVEDLLSKSKMPNPNKMRILRDLGNKVLALKEKGQLNLTSAGTSSVRENLVRKLVWPGLDFVPENEAETPEFITETVNLLDTLSDFEIERRLSIFDETIALMIRMEEDDPSVSDQEPYVLFERALREVQSMSKQVR